MTPSTRISPGRATVAQRLRDLSRSLLCIADRRSLRQWLGLSQRALGIALGRFSENGRGPRAFHKSTVGHIEHGDYTLHGQRLLYQRVLDEAVRAASGGLLTVRLDRRYRVAVYRLCPCRCPFRWEGADVVHCPRCRRSPSGGRARSRR